MKNFLKAAHTNDCAFAKLDCSKTFYDHRTEIFQFRLESHASDGGQDESFGCSRDGLNVVAVASPGVLLDANRRDVHRHLRVLDEFHQPSRHVIWSSNAIVALTVFTEAQENCVDGHLVDREKAVADEKRENAANNDWNRGVVQARFVLEIQ